MTVAAIKEMRHALGLDYKSPKGGKYVAYRNYAMYNAPEPVWEGLVAEGLAQCNIVEDNKVLMSPFYSYSLTRAGLDLVGAMIGARIEVTE